MYSYPDLTVTYLYSSISFAPKCHCDIADYLYNDKKTIEAHRDMQRDAKHLDVGCQNRSLYSRGQQCAPLPLYPIALCRPMIPETLCNPEFA